MYGARDLSEVDGVYDLMVKALWLMIRWTYCLDMVMWGWSG